MAFEKYDRDDLISLISDAYKDAQATARTWGD